MFSKSKGYLLSLAISAVIMPGVATASDASEAALDTGAYIKSVNERIAKHSAELRELELRVQIEEKQKALQDIVNPEDPKASDSSANPTGSANAPSSQSLPPEVIAEMKRAEEEKERRNLPSVKSVEGTAGTLQAILMMSDRSTHAVRVGDRLNTGWKVVSIDVNTVTVSKGKETINLPFGERIFLQPERTQQAGFGPDSFAAPPSQAYGSQPPF
jgi:type IV pilus biogenesis protein PilP